MAFKFVIISCLVALARAGNIPAAVVAEPVVVEAPAPLARLEEFDPFPSYRYAYSVEDTFTGDVKSQYEQRDGDVVTGEYSLIDPDNTLRIVKYTADSVNGFNAVVSKQPLVAQAVVAEPAPVVAEPAVVPARIAPAPFVPAPVAPTRYVAAPYSAFRSPLAQYAQYQPFARFTAAGAPFAYPGTAAQVVAV